MRRNVIAILLLGIALSLLIVISNRPAAQSKPGIEESKPSDRVSSASSQEPNDPGNSGNGASGDPKSRLVRILKGELDRSEIRLSEQEIYEYLRANRSNSLSMVTAFELTHDSDYLKRAAELHPTDPLVLAKVLMHNVFPEERAKWAEAFKKAAPDNSFPYLLAAQAAMKAGDVAKAQEEVQSTVGRTFNDFSKESMVGLEEAYLSAGRSVADAKALSTSELMLPHLTQMKALAVDFNQRAGELGAAGDPEGQQKMLISAWMAGSALREADGGAKPTVILTDLVGLAMENIALNNWPAGKPAPDWLNRTVAEEQEQNKIYRADLRAGRTLINNWLPAAPENEIVSYLDRIKTFGEFNALDWLRSRHPELIEPQ